MATVMQLACEVHALWEIQEAQHPSSATAEATVADLAFYVCGSTTHLKRDYLAPNKCCNCEQEGHANADC